MSKTTTTGRLSWAPAADGREAKSPGGLYLAQKAGRGKYTLLFAPDDTGGDPVELLAKAPLAECLARAEQHTARKAKKAGKKAPVPPEPAAAVTPTPVPPEPETAPARPARPRELRRLKEGQPFTLDGRAGTFLGMVGEDAKVQMAGERQAMCWSGGVEVVPCATPPGGAGHGHNGTAKAPKGPSGTPVAVTGNQTAIPVGCTEGKKGGRRYTLWGEPVTGYLRWMGANGWSVGEAKAAVGKLGLAIGENTYKCQIASGKGSAAGRKDLYGPVPELTKDRQKELKGLRG
jgi:hypothetical protein